MQTATLRRSVYTKFGGYYSKGATVEVVSANVINDSITIKTPNYDGPIVISLKAKDLIFDVKWKEIR
jgi:hypothetical protein